MYSTVSISEHRRANWRQSSSIVRLLLVALIWSWGGCRVWAQEDLEQLSAAPGPDTDSNQRSNPSPDHVKEGTAVEPSTHTDQQASESGVSGQVKDEERITEANRGPDRETTVDKAAVEDTSSVGSQSRPDPYTHEDKGHSGKAEPVTMSKASTQSEITGDIKPPSELPDDKPALVEVLSNQAIDNGNVSSPDPALDESTLPSMNSTAKGRNERVTANSEDSSGLDVSSITKKIFTEEIPANNSSNANETDHAAGSAVNTGTLPIPSNSTLQSTDASAKDTKSTPDISLAHVQPKEGNSSNITGKTEPDHSDVPKKPRSIADFMKQVSVEGNRKPSESVPGIAVNQKGKKPSYNSKTNESSNREKPVKSDTRSIGKQQQGSTQKTHMTDTSVDHPKAYCGVWGVYKWNRRYADLSVLFVLFQDLLLGDLTGDLASLDDMYRTLTSATSVSPLGPPTTTSKDEKINTKQSPHSERAPKPANTEFVEGFDDLHKLFERVEPPDDFDVGAAGSSLKEFLMGQGTRIVIKRIRMGITFLQSSLLAAKDTITRGLREFNPPQMNNFRKEEVVDAAQRIWERSKKLFTAAQDLLDNLFEGGDLGDDLDEFDAINMKQMDAEGSKK